MTTSGATPFLTAAGYNAGAAATGIDNTFFGFESGKLHQQERTTRHLAFNQ
jgi:hypothetical protein